MPSTMRQDDRIDYQLNYAGPTQTYRTAGGKTLQAGTMPDGRSFVMTPQERQRIQHVQESRKRFDNLYNTARVVGLGVPAVGAGLALAGVGSAGAGAASSVGAGSAGYASPGVYGGVSFGAPTAAASGGGGAMLGAGGGMVGPAAAAGRTFAGLSMGDLLRLGAGGVTNYFGQRAQGRALDRQLEAERYGLDQQMQFAREQEDFRRAEAARVAEEDRRRWEAEQANREREYQLAIEDRARSQRYEDEDRAQRQQARLTMGDLIRMGPQYIRR